MHALGVEGGGIAARTAEGDRHRFDSLYVALGLRARSGLATALGAAHDEDGALSVDPHQQTTVPGLYAAGDVVQGLAQISVAMGQAAARRDRDPQQPAAAARQPEPSLAPLVVRGPTISP